MGHSKKTVSLSHIRAEVFAGQKTIKINAGFRLKKKKNQKPTGQQLSPIQTKWTAFQHKKYLNMRNNDHSKK